MLSATQGMGEAFTILLDKFLVEFQQHYPSGPRFDRVKLWCINYCARYELDEDFSDVFSPSDLFFKIGSQKFCNVLTLGLLQELANHFDIDCLKNAIEDYNETFCNIKLRNQVSAVSSHTVAPIRKGSRFKPYRLYARFPKLRTCAGMFTKSKGIGMTYSQAKNFRAALCYQIICIHPNSTTISQYGENCVYLGWQIPSCLVEAAYHAACTNTMLFAQLGIKYLIIEQYKIEPPTTCVRETPMELFCRHYQYLVQVLQPVEVANLMYSENLLRQKEFIAIMNAPCDHIKSCMIIEHVRHQAMSYLFVFLSVLQNISSQDHVYDTLVNALSVAGYTSLPDSFELMQDDDSDSIETNVWQSSPDKHSFLNMNLSTGSRKQQFLTLPDSKELKDSRQFKPTNVNIQYLYLMDTMYKLLESHDTSVFIDKCAGLMASDTHKIALFSKEFLQQLNECGDMFIILKFLVCYSTWCDYSVVKRLLEICKCSVGLELLKQFESQINFTLPITHFPISVPSSLMIPSDSSDFTIMTTQCVQEYTLLSLKHIKNVKSLISKVCDVNDICCQLMAKKDNPVILFWLVPKSLVSLIGTKVQECYDDLRTSGIIEVAFYPSNTGSIWSPSFLFTDFKYGKRHMCC